MSVTVCWNKRRSPLIRVKRGTRQGGLSSPFLFNIFYMSLIEQLDDMHELRREHWESSLQRLSYADDVLLASTTVTGLQRLIDTAVAVVDDLGLKFNPAKTATMTYGRCSLRYKPSWSIGQSTLAHEESITYLGAVLHTTGTVHVERRMSSAQKAFYGLQSAGLHFKGVDPHVSAKLFSVGVRSVMMYGAEAIALNQSNIKALVTLQGKMVKSFLGLRLSSRNTPLLAALKIPSITDSLACSAENLLRSCLIHYSRATDFYAHLLKQNSFVNGANLIHRCFKLCDNFNVSALFWQSHLSSRKQMFPKYGSDGLIDTVIGLLDFYSPEARSVLQMLVNPF